MAIGPHGAHDVGISGLPSRAAIAARATAFDRPHEGYLRRRTAFPLSHSHGHRQLAELGEIDPSAIAALGRAAKGGHTEGTPGRPVFFDIETTSLSSGAGSYVFLVGFAAVGESAFVVDQLLLRDPAGELEFLEAVAEHVRAAPLLVSFAGRGFDERRLEDRYRFARVRPPFDRARHADLYPVARALWKGRLDSCALGVIEGARLGFRREGDIPGEACPEAWFRSVRGDAAAREAVLRHNLLDLMSTAMLAVEVAAVAAGPRAAAESLGLGLHEWRRGRPSEALRLLLEADQADAALQAKGDRGAWPPSGVPENPRYQAGIVGAGGAPGAPGGSDRRGDRGGCLRPEERRTLGLAAARLLRRAGRHDEAAARLRTLATAPNPCFEAWIELAKHDEHRARDIASAAGAATRALSLLRRGLVDLSPARREAVDQDLVRRLARLEARLARSEPVPETGRGTPSQGHGRWSRRGFAGEATASAASGAPAGSGAVDGSPAAAESGASAGFGPDASAACASAGSRPAHGSEASANAPQTRPQPRQPAGRLSMTNPSVREDGGAAAPAAIAGRIELRRRGAGEGCVCRLETSGS